MTSACPARDKAWSILRRKEFNCPGNVVSDLIISDFIIVQRYCAEMGTEKAPVCVLCFLLYFVSHGKGEVIQCLLFRYDFIQ